MEQALESFDSPEEAAKILLMAQNGDLPPTLSKSINSFLREGKMNEAVVAAIEEQINSLPDDSEMKAKMKRRKDIALMAGGGALLMLFLLITQGLAGNRQ